MPAPPAAGTSSRWGRVAFTLNAGLAVGYVALWLSMAAGGRFWQADFSAFYTGWSIVLDGRADDLYDLGVQADYQRRIVSDRPEWQGVLGFVNPPHSAVPLALLAHLPLTTAFYAWSLLQLGMLAVVLHWLWQLCADWSEGERRLVVASVLAFPPLLMTFQLGQFALLGLLALVGFYRAVKRGSDLSAAAWLVLGTIKPQAVVLAGALLLGARRWRVLGIALALFAAWAALTTALLGWNCWPGFLDAVRFNGSQFGTYGIYPLRMYNLKSLLTAALGGSHSAVINALTTALLLAAVAVTLWLWRGTWRPAAADFDLCFALTVLLGLVCSPHLNPADALALVLPAVLYYGHVRRGFAALLVLAPLLFLIDSFAIASWPGGVRPFILFMLFLAFALARELWALHAVPAAPAPRAA